MIERTHLEAYLHDFLKCGNFNDYAPNGVQVEGRAAISRICTAVTASKEVIEKAIAHKADALLVHHGYFWRGEEPTITGMKRDRVSLLLNHEITLFAYHLPLDCHLSLGNNACLGRLFEVSLPFQHAAGKTEDLLWSGELKKALSGDEFANVIESTLGRTPLHIAVPKRAIKRIAWCSGGAQDFIEEAARLGVDAYLSGEVSERTYYQAQELGLHYYACGHHATERYGIKALGEHVAKQFQLKCQFIDSDNPV